MKPQVGWDTEVQYLKSVGPARARALGRLGVERVGDLLTHLPRTWFDRSRLTPISALVPGREATVAGQVLTAGERRTRRGRSLQTVSVADDGGVVFCQWFGQSYLLKQFRSGARVMLSGAPQVYEGRLQLVHPDFEILDREQENLHTGRLVPVYPLTRGVGQHWLRRLVHDTLALVADGLPETLPAELRRRRQLCGRGEALRGLHFPIDAAQRDAARRRLVYEEIFLIQLTMALRRRGRASIPGIRLDRPGDLTARLVAGLPFALTGAQRRVLAEILRDLRGEGVMHRLLQGDVGSGKTLVALIACLFVVEQGWQALFMAPTEVLARQHGETLGRLCADLDVRLATLTGATPAAERRAILAAVAAREVDLLLGTHALIQQEVSVPRLALSVADEQHRFGVQQRVEATRRSDAPRPPHVLVMSATPIPRSLSLTLCGDLDLSLLDEMPAGRLPVRTEILGESDLPRLYADLLAELDRGRQGFIVYPVIEETEGQDLKSATAEFEALGEGPFKGRRLALLHGRLRPAEKSRIMAEFSAGAIELLVATTVVEVGVDVPNATAMVIHHPERFGLAQLHQLRGRVGRGRDQARCWLVADRWLPPDAYERLRYFADNADGFALAEEDLRRRGPGDLVGVRQHGVPSFRLANPLRDAALVQDCAEDAAALLATDPHLRDPGHRPLAEALQANYGRLLPRVRTG